MMLSDGNYEISEIQKLPTVQRNPGRIAACRTANNEYEWWIASLGLGTNDMKIFHVGGDELLKDSTTFEIPQDWPLNTSRQATFSPNRQHYAFGTDDSNIWLFDFDNASGELSNLRRIDLPDDVTTVRGVCFSPDSELVYLTADTCLYQLEIATETVRRVACHYSFSETGWPISVGEMYLGPDCRIYVSPSTTTWYIHTIHRPNEIGEACLFQPRAIRTPTRLSFALMNMPNYRDGTDCLDIPWPFADPTTATEEVTLQPDNIRVYPNPATDWITIESEQLDRLQSAELLDLTCRVIRAWPLRGTLSRRLDVHRLPAGTYLLRIRTDEGAVTKRVVVGR